MRLDNLVMKNSLTYKMLNIETWLTFQLNKEFAYVQNIPNAKHISELSPTKKNSVTNRHRKHRHRKFFGHFPGPAQIQLSHPCTFKFSTCSPRLDFLIVWFTCSRYVSRHKCVLQGKAIFFHRLCKALTVRGFCAQPRPVRCRKKSTIPTIPIQISTKNWLFWYVW